MYAKCELGQCETFYILFYPSSHFSSLSILISNRLELFYYFVFVHITMHDHWEESQFLQRVAGVTTVKVLNALDALDRHSFERVDASNSLDTLYAKIFPAATSAKDKDSQEETRVQYVSMDTALARLASCLAC
jgi:hypothetical protein